MAEVGEKLPIALKLFDDFIGAKVRARIFDETGAEITGSPFTLSHLTTGLYTIGTVLMPDRPFITVIYEVFIDAAFTIKDIRYLDATACFTKDVDLADEVDQLINAARSVDLNAEINDTEALVATVEDTEVLDATIKDPKEIVAKVSDIDQLKAEIDDDNSLTGNVDCT